MVRTATFSNFRKIKEAILFQLAVVYTRFLLGGALVFASFIKIKGNRFTSASGETTAINRYTHFFETMYQSGLYWKFIGLGQLLSGAFLLTQRLSRLGALSSFPILLNIFVITISYDFAFTPVITGTMLAANAGLIFCDGETVKFFLNKTSKPYMGYEVERSVIWEYTGWALLIFTSIYRIFNDRYNILFWLAGCLLICFVGFIFWFMRRKGSQN